VMGHSSGGSRLNVQRTSRERNLRRWIGAVVCLAVLGFAALVIPRLAPRSPIAIVALCALAVLTMKLVERRVRQWFNYWAARQASRTTDRDRRE
jgi:membrane protein implicated in regulation of membrane protease activity